MDKMWCIVKRIAEEVENGVPGVEQKEDAVQKDDDSYGEYILLKDFNKVELRLYKKDTTESDEDEEENEEKA